MSFFITIIIDFFVAFGILIGGCLLGGLGAFLMGEPPIHFMNQLADKIRIWAVVAAIGGTIDTLSVIERSFFEGSHSVIIKHLLFIFSAFLGAHIGFLFIRWITGEAS